MIYKETPVEKSFAVINYILLIILGFLTLYPFIYFVILSFNDGFDAMKGGIYLWPREFTLDNYRKAFENPLIINSFMISVFRTVVGTSISIILTSLAAYALTKRDLPGRSAIVFYFFFTTIFSGGLIPLYILLRQLHLTTSIWIYVIPHIFNFFNIIIMRTYFDTFPDSLYEAAIIDGCSDLGIYFRIYLPLAGPILATITLFYGVAHWNDWYTGSFFVSNEELKPAASILQQILNEATFESSGIQGQQINAAIEKARAATTPEALRMTFLVIITVPIVCVYPFLQKYLVKGAMIGSIKG
jgi:putative aldouronate transport system permease protein